MALRGKDSKNGGKNILDVTASMQGELSFTEPVNLRISGNFKGKLIAKGSLIISDTADVEAEIQGETVILSGKMKGVLQASKLAHFKAPAVFEGDLYTPSLIVEEGAVIEGACHMTDNDMMSLDEVSEYLKIEKASILKWAEEGSIPARRSNSHWVFRRRDIDVWLLQDKK